MTAQPTSYTIPLPAPAREEPAWDEPAWDEPAWDELEAAPDEDPELPTRQCLRCGAVGTHYLTCPSLRLPSGYSLTGPGLPSVVRRCRGGPDHPDWPRPPQSAGPQV